jgi:hypothetical protein
MTIFNYTVNYIDVALVVIFLLFASIGYKRGLFFTVINFVRYALGFSLCFYLSNNLTQPIYDNYLRQKALDTINTEIATTSNVDEVISNLNNYVSSLPKFISNSLNIDSLTLSTKDVSESLLTNIFEPIILAITKGAIFIAVFLVFFIATGVIIKTVRKASKRRDAKRGKKSFVKKTDKFFGTLFGSLKAFIVILAITSILMYILNLTDNTATSNVFLNEAYNSQLLHLIDSINPFNAITQGLI